MTFGSQSPLINQQRRHRRAMVLVAIAALLQFTLFLNHRDITTSHEGRVVVGAREMIQSGDWLIPHVNNQLRLQKPPLPYWLAAINWKISGSTEPWLARLPCALCGAMCALLIGDLARCLFGLRARAVAAVVWITTWFIVDEFRKAMPDPYLSFFTLLSVWAWIRAYPPSTRRESAAPRSRALVVLLAYAALGLGNVSKGPMILLHVALALIPYHLLFRPRTHVKRSIHVVGIALFAIVSFVWPVYVALRIPGVWHLWITELSADTSSRASRFDSIPHYIVNLPLTSAPWSVCLLIGVLLPLVSRRRRDRRALWPLIWLGLTILIFTCIPMKKNAYILPAMPAQTLLITAAICSAIRSPRFLTGRGGDRMLLIGHAVAAIITLAVMLYLLLGVEEFEIAPPAPLLAAGAVALFTLLAFRKIFPRIVSMRTFTITGIFFGVAIEIAAGWVRPEIDNRRSDRSFAQSINDAAEGENLVIIGAGIREEVLFYLGRTIPTVAMENLPADYQGFALVSADDYPKFRNSPRCDEVVDSGSSRDPDDRVYLFHFPKAPPQLQRGR